MTSNRSPAGEASSTSLCSRVTRTPFRLQLRSATCNAFSETSHETTSASSKFLAKETAMQPLLSEERYQKLREMAAGDGFDRLMAELLLDESTMSIIRTVPSHTQGDELRAEETERLQAIQASWTDADKEALRVQNEKLTAWQQTPDTAEQLATLPVLSLSEISADPLLIPAAEAQCGAAKVITHDLSMNGITIMHWYILSLIHI